MLAALGLPLEAYPQQAQRGQHSYTIGSASGAKVEVQHRNKCFFVKKTASGGKPSHRTIKFNAENAAAQWALCKETCGW